MVRWGALGPRTPVPGRLASPRGAPPLACRFFCPELDRLFLSQTQFGVTIGGEYSNGINDCGFYLNGVPTYTPLNPNCAFWDAWEDWDQNPKAGLLNFALASMDALENPFFWTWKVRKPRGHPLPLVLTLP